MEINYAATDFLNLLRHYKQVPSGEPIQARMIKRCPALLYQGGHGRWTKNIFI
jgi:hypothetical protein